MAMLVRRSKGRGRRRQMADINVTPMVDVMLVLLVVFMITAPMLATGVAVNLPKTRAEALPNDQKEQPLMVTLDKAGKIYVGTQKTPVALAQLAPQLKAIAQEKMDKRVYVRADKDVAYGEVMNVLTLLQRSGFTNAGLPVDSKDIKRVDDLLKKDATP
jgi:biopolymer transport protein TolR